MEIIPYGKLPKQFKEFRRKLEEENGLLVTTDEGPLAMMFLIPKEGWDDLVMRISQIRAQPAVSGMRQQARRRGKGQLTKQEITAFIQEVRVKRRTKHAN